MKNCQIQTLGGAACADINGITLTEPLDDANVSMIRAVLGSYAEESPPLLVYLYHHATHPGFTCRFHWQPGSVAFWDNRASLHDALNDDAGNCRPMHRITLGRRGTVLTNLQPRTAR